MSLLIAPSISKTDLLSPSEFCKIYPLVVNLFPTKIKQLPSAGRVKHFVKNWQKLIKDPVILQNPFYFAAKAIMVTKFVSVNERSNRSSESRGPGHVEEGCYSNFGS